MVVMAKPMKMFAKRERSPARRRKVFPLNVDLAVS